MPNLFTSNTSSQRSVLTVSICLVTLASLLMATTVVHAQSPDFAITSTPSSLCVNPGVNGVAAITVQSVDGFTGTVNLASNIDPTVSNGPTLSPIPSSESLVAGQSVSFNLAISTSASTPLYTYTIQVSGLYGANFHQATVQLTVSAGCSVGGVVLPAAGLAPAGSFLVFGLIVAGLVGIVGATVAVRVSRRKLSPNL
jgi:hypothetical protein